ncbi:hypothetical protein OSB04_020797 [Centaurea solstitialis]|uniref:Uncharacterized protein n=1 Tax=Centaurea solstitialis TaxID=347529 RepID=A0AA38WFL6_9ASTR|nr:hypothetical protein OSB04_020797 [Centaurea solstitialis]
MNGNQSTQTSDLSPNNTTNTVRYAVVTGANKGIGFETVRQLAASGVTVLLTARNEKRGTEAVSVLHGLGFSNVLYHQLDVNNAGASGVVVDEDGLRALNIDPASWLSGKATNMVQGVMKTTYDKAKECLNTNYYGVKNVIRALLPLLERSTSGARIINVSSLRGELWRIPNEQIRKELGDVETLSEKKIDGFVEKFLEDLSNDALEANGWSKMLPAYSVSKAMLNAYTRVLAKTYPNMCINCVHPGYVDTDLNWHTGTMTLEEGAQGNCSSSISKENLKRNQTLAAVIMNGNQSTQTSDLSPNNTTNTVRYAVVTGANKGIGFETVRQLAASGVTVLLTARNEMRGTEAVSVLHGLGFSNVNNAGASGVVVDEDGLRALNIDPASWLSGRATNMVQGVMKTTYDKAKECLNINYYGVKNVIRALLPLLERSTSGARIVNVSSLQGELWRIPNEQIRKELGDVETLSEKKIDGFVEKFLEDLSNDALEANGWSKMLPAYSVSKAMLNAYTRVLAKSYPNMCINCVHPGYVDTDSNWHTGIMTLEEGAQGSVMLALLPQGGNFSGDTFLRRLPSRPPPPPTTITKLTTSTATMSTTTATTTITKTHHQPDDPDEDSDDDRRQTHRCNYHRQPPPQVLI